MPTDTEITAVYLLETLLQSGQDIQEATRALGPRLGLKLEESPEYIQLVNSVINYAERVKSTVEVEE